MIWEDYINMERSNTDTANQAVGWMDSDSVIMLSRPESEFPFEFRRPILVPLPASVSVPGGLWLLCDCVKCVMSPSSMGETGGVGEEDKDSNCSRSSCTPDWWDGGKLVLLLPCSSVLSEVARRSCDLACSAWCGLFLIRNFPLSPLTFWFCKWLSPITSSMLVTTPSAELSFLDTIGGELECLSLTLAGMLPLERSYFFFFLTCVSDDSRTTWSRPEWKQHRKSLDVNQSINQSHTHTHTHFNHVVVKT